MLPVSFESENRTVRGILSMGGRELLIFIRFSPVKGDTLGNAKTLVMVLVLRIDRDDQRPLFIAAAHLTIGVCLNDRGGDRNGYLYRHVLVTSLYEYTLGGNHDPSMKSTR